MSHRWVAGTYLPSGTGARGLPTGPRNTLGESHMARQIVITLENHAAGTVLELESSYSGDRTILRELPEIVGTRASWTSRGSGFAVGSAGGARYRIMGADGSRLGTAGFAWDAPFVGEGSCDAWVVATPAGSPGGFSVGHVSDLEGAAMIRFVLASSNEPAELTGLSGPGNHNHGDTALQIAV